MAGLASSAAIVCMTLPETLNKPTMEDLTQDKKKSKEEQNDNKNAKDGKEEEATLVWLRAMNKNCLLNLFCNKLYTANELF